MGLLHKHDLPAAFEDSPPPPQTFIRGPITDSSLAHNLQHNTPTSFQIMRTSFYTTVSEIHLGCTVFCSRVSSLITVLGLANRFFLLPGSISPISHHVIDYPCSPLPIDHDNRFKTKGALVRFVL